MILVLGYFSCSSIFSRVVEELSLYIIKYLLYLCRHNVVNDIVDYLGTY